MTLLEEAEKLVDAMTRDAIMKESGGDEEVAALKNEFRFLREIAIRLKAESLAIEEAMKEMREIIVEIGWEGPWFYSKAIGILRRHLEEARK